jgi:hypothetical protein
MQLPERIRSRSWPSPGLLTVAAIAAALGLLLVASAGAETRAEEERREARIVVHTDGHLRPGHLETIWVRGFPGPGALSVDFFPTAICEGGCGAESFTGRRTDAQGRARFRVRVPNTFFTLREKPVFFRNRERISLDVRWEGRGQEEFASGRAEPEPVIVRTHR